MLPDTTERLNMNFCQPTEFPDGPINLDATINARASASGPGLNTVDFSHTIEIGNFEFFDQNGDRIYGTLTSALGFEYSQALAVPEPCTLTLVGLGTVGLLVSGMRRRRPTKAA